MLKQFFDALLDFFYSPICPNCGSVCLQKDMFCATCRAETTFVRLYTGQELKYLDAVIVLAHYRSGWQNVLHKIKFLGEKNLLKVLQNELSIIWQDKGKDVLRDWLLKYSLGEASIAVIPVPTDKKRYDERGFDVPVEVFKKWCLANGFSWQECLFRVRTTTAQYSLSGEKRKTNMQNVVDLEYLPKEKVLLVVDDVLTTGATMIECARSIREKDGENKFIIGLALASDVSK